MTLLRCVHCGHEQAFYLPANGHYYDLCGASILLCGSCHGAAFRIAAEEDRETSTTRRLASVTYAYGSLGEYVEADAADEDEELDEVEAAAFDEGVAALNRGDVLTWERAKGELGW